MSERKPAHLSWQGFAEQQIQAAQQVGAFQNLPGAGQPIPGIDEPLDENWWIRKKLRDEQVRIVPPLVEAQQDIERTRVEILKLRSESVVRARLQELRERVQRAIMSPLPSPPVVVLPIDVEAELARWRQQRH
jgi:hypothetical protein